MFTDITPNQFAQALTHRVIAMSALRVKIRFWLFQKYDLTREGSFILTYISSFAIQILKLRTSQVVAALVSNLTLELERQTIPTQL